MKTLDLGCGANPKNPFSADEVFGVDVRGGGEKIKQANLFLEPIPFGDGFFDFVTAHDFIEHLPRTLSIYDAQSGRNEIIFPFVAMMNEVFRVLKPGGSFFSKTPAFPHPEAFQDPTHCNIITEKTFPLYFNDHYPVAHIYGFVGGFKMKEQVWDGCHLLTTMVKGQRPDISKFVAY